MSPLNAIAADALILADGVLPRPLLIVEDGLVARVTTQDEVEAPAGTLQWGGTLAPGFFDVHVHGAGGRDVMEGSAKAIATVGTTLARYGTTYFSSDDRDNDHGSHAARPGGHRGCS